MYKFDAKKTKDELVEWIKDWFEHNGKDCIAIVGISGGVDSSVVAALCVEALGESRVFGVLMPAGEQADIHYSWLLCNHLNISYKTININYPISNVLSEMILQNIKISNQTQINLPPRIRMATLYAVSQSMNGRVANTSNLSESYVGYDTKWGDSVGDFSPLANLTKTEIREVAQELGLPEKLINKTPLDGLCGKTDEENFGFTYKVLDRYIRTGEIDDLNIKKKIDEMHEKNLFKLQSMPSFKIN